MATDDHIALEALLGTRDSQLCDVRHFIYVPDRDRGEELAGVLRREGFGVDLQMSADGSNWLVRATHTIIPDEEALEQLRVQLEKLAEAAGGEYDGWDAGAV